MASTSANAVGDRDPGKMVEQVVVAGTKDSAKAAQRPGLPTVAAAAAANAAATAAAAETKLPRREVYGEGIGHSQFILEKVGKIQDVYELEGKKLGQGAYGAVRRGTHRDLKIMRAIKTIQKDRVGSNVDRFKKEIAILKMMDHPGIIKLYETFEDSKSVYLVMELCQGGELFDRILANGHFTESSAATVMQQIMRAVNYIHESGVVHRDLKPENFLLLNKGPIDTNCVKIIDFGLSCERKNGEMLSTKVGTPYYVAPQVLAGRYDNMCDLWSCGVITYILLVGYPPFAGHSDAEVFAKVRAGNVSFERSDWRFISNDAQDLIRQLLKMNPRERLTAHEALNHEWIKCAAPRAAQVSLRPGFVESLRTFRYQSKLKKAALHVIANQMSEGDIKAMRETFLSMDGNGDGQLTMDELKTGLENAGFGDAISDLADIVQSIDSDGNGNIDYTEFLAATLDSKAYLKEEACRAAFRTFDLNGDGRISQAELFQVLNTDGIPEAVGLRRVEELVAEVDINGDGDIDFEEFMTMMRTNSNV